MTASYVPPIGQRAEQQPQLECSREQYVIRGPGDLNQLSGCELVEGDILVTNFKHPLLSFGDKLKEVKGSVIVEKSPDLVRLEAPGLHLIRKAFKLHQLTSLSLVLMPNLQLVRDLDWQVLPIFSNIQIFPSIANVSRIVISDTSLMGFAGFNTDDLDILDINNNRFLDSIKCNVVNIKEKLHIAANSRDLTLQLPNLSVVNNLTIHDVSQIDLTKLQIVNNSMSIIQNNLQLLKIPHLSKVGGTLSFLKNEALTSIDIPELLEVGGGLMILNNTRLDKINFVPRLTMIGGALELAGNLKEAKFPSLKLVKGSAIIRSFVSLFDCNRWSQSDIRTIVRGGKIECGIGNEPSVSFGSSAGEATEFESTTGYNGNFNETRKIFVSSGASMAVSSTIFYQIGVAILILLGITYLLN